MKILDHVEEATIVVVVLLLFTGLGYYLRGRSDPWQQLATYCDQVAVLRLNQLEQLKADVETQVPVLLQEQNAKFKDATRLLNNLVKVVEGESEQSEEEALTQAKERLIEWGERPIAGQQP